MKKLYAIIMVFMVFIGVHAQQQIPPKPTRGNTPEMKNQAKHPVVSEILKHQYTRTAQAENDFNTKREQKELSAKIDFAQNVQLGKLRERMTLREQRLIELKKKNAETIKKTGNGLYAKSILNLENQQIQDQKLMNQLLINQSKEMGVKKSVSPIRNLKSGNEYQKLDSIISYSWYDGAKKENYQYDGDGNATFFLSQWYDSTMSKWMDYEKYNIKYDTSGNFTEYTGYMWHMDKMVWVPYEQGFYKWDAMGNMILENYDRWDTITSKWIPDYKYISTYDKNGFKTLSEEYEWQVDSSEWYGTYKHINGYDSEGRDTFNANYYWDDIKDVWYGSNKYISSYDKAGNKLLDESYYWNLDSADWDGSYKSVYAYQWDSLQTLYEYYQWDYVLNKWYPNSKTVYAYDGKGNRIREDYSYWNADSMRLINSSKYEYAFDAAGNEILSSYYYWDSNSGTWTGNYKWTKSYNSSGKKLSELTYYWDGTTKSWISSYRYQYAYDSNGYETLNQYDYWDNTLLSWIGYNKEVKGFDQFGNDTLTISYYWNLSTSKWDTSYFVGPIAKYPNGLPKTLIVRNHYGPGLYDTTGKFELAYDANKHLILKEQYNRNTGLWDLFSKYEYAYDSHGNDTLVVSYTYDYYLSTLLPNSKDQSAYDSQNRQILFASYYWNQDSGRWDGSHKEEHAYDANGNKILDVSWGWDYNKGVWMGYYKDMYAFDTKNEQILYESYSWNIDSGEWVGEYKYEHQMDQYGHPIIQADYTWDPVNEKWIGTQKYVYTFKDEYFLLLESRYFWDYTLDNWMGDYKREFKYDQDGTGIEKVSSIWDSNTNGWMAENKEERLFDYTFDINYLYQPSWVYEDHYYFDYYGPPQEYRKKSGYTGQNSEFYQEIRYRLISQKKSVWVNNKWVIEMQERFFYSGFGVKTGNISGNVVTTTNEPVTSGSVLLYPFVATGRTQPVDSIRILFDGSFEFIAVPVGNYVIVAIPDTALYPTALATYYGDVAVWNQATVINVTDGSSTKGVTIHAVIPPVLNGQATLSGVIEEDVAVKNGTINRSVKSINGRPVKGASVVLVGRNKAGGVILARTVTDEFGNFSFKKVPVGEYDILVDIPGVELKTYHTVTVKTGDTEIADLNYVVSENGISNEISESFADRFILYPNPAKDFINLFVESDNSGMNLVKIFDLNGSLKQLEYLPAGHNRIDLKLNRGIYILEIGTAQGLVDKKLIVQ